MIIKLKVSLNNNYKDDNFAAVMRPEIISKCIYIMHYNRLGSEKQKKISLNL